ncbi:MAG: N-acetylglucosamine kinase [Flavobacteriaceae bacterium]|nr:N-acetylglucosamine kinase [Flavobacteriaceae bacterium]
MILIADSGSTKTSWIAVDNKGRQLFLTKTKGLNPAVFKKEVLKKRLTKNKKLTKNKEQIKTVYFYGAGCGTKTSKKNLKKILNSFFKNAKITIKEDIKAAVYAVTTEPSIVCILGTGSNCSYFDGKKTHQKIKSLGYSIMDDASGNYFGKTLLRDYFYNKMPKNFADGFALKYNLNPNKIKKNLYQKENPNTYLAGFSHYLIHHKNENYAQKIINNGLKLFIENQILQYKESKKLPIHFIGSVAFFLKDEIQLIFKEYNLKLGKIERYPINGLVKYHF